MAQRSRFIAGAFALAAGAAVLGARPRAQEPFRAVVRTVPIYATALDRAHHLVTNLTRDDFEVRDNGKPVTLSVFSSEPDPVAMAIMLDSSGSMADKLPLVTRATGELIDRLNPQDQALIGAFGGLTLTSLGLTSDHADLADFLRTRVHAGGQTPLWNALDIAMVRLKDTTLRRVVLVFTDGYDTTTLDHGFDAVMARADAEQVMVYAIGCWDGPGTGDLPPDSGLRKLADHTGGGYTELVWDDSADLASIFTRVSDELHHQYVLGFTPARLDGKTHTIDVAVRRPNLEVRARKKYVAAE